MGECKNCEHKIKYTLHDKTWWHYGIGLYNKRRGINKMCLDSGCQCGCTKPEPKEAKAKAVV